MKNWIIIISIVLLPSISFGQIDTVTAINEFKLAINRTNIQDSYSENLFGFGLGVYHVFLQNKKVNLVTGLEYNRTNQLKKSIYDGHFAHKTNVTFNINCISIPMTARINFGRKIKIFLNTGLFIDLSIGGREKGTMKTYFTNENDQLESRVFQYSQKSRLGSNYGFILGVGIDIPLYKYRIIVEPDYKFGMRNIYQEMDEIRNRYFRINIGLRI